MMTSVFGGTFGRRAGSAVVFLALLASFLIVPAQPALAAGVCVPAPGGLITWLRAEGNANDVFNANNGTSNGATFSTGFVGQAFGFNGTSSVTLASPPAVSPTGSWTYDLWINVTSYDGSTGLGQGTGSYFVDRTSESNNLADLKAFGTQFDLQTRYDQAGSTLEVIGGAITTGAWTHVAAVRDRDMQLFRLYVNGVEVNTASDNGNSLTLPTPKLGHHDLASNQGFVGQIDEYSIYNRALSASEIQSIFNAGSAGKCPITLRSGNGAIGTLDPLVQFSLDGTTWQQAPIVSPHSAWSTIPGTQWVSVSRDRQGPAAGADFRFTFQLPNEATSPSLSFSILADNAATIFLNGHLVGGQAVAGCPGANFGGPATTISTSKALFFQSGVNTVVINDDNGFRGCNPPFNFPNDMGIDFVATVTFAVDTTAPVITPSATTADGATYSAGTWTNQDVTVTWKVSDPESGIASRNGCETRTLTAETPVDGTTLTCSATNGVGLSASRSFTVKIDKTPPEAVNSFNPATLDLAVSGRDGLSGVKSVTLVSTAPAPKKGPIGGDKAVRRTYVITDNAGNTTTLVEDVRRAGHELKATKISIQYGSQAAIAFPENELKFEWALDKTGALKELEQEIEIGKGKARQEVEAKFEAKKGTTTIRVERPEPETKSVRVGLVLLQLATANQNGELKIEY